MTLEEVREDLKEIRYYYSMKDMFDSGAKTVLPVAVLEKVERYNKAIAQAPAKMYILYLSLYVRNNSQTTLAGDWGYTPNYVKDLNNMLIEFLRKQLN
jgi:hypothetical protein